MTNREQAGAARWERPFRLATNRMSYLIPGGNLIDRFLGEPEGEDPMASQMWIASTVCTALGGGREGYSRLAPEDGGESFPEVLAAGRERLLGKEFAERFGGTPGFLLKLLNSRDRLLVQVHPDAEKAGRYFGMPCGKTEAWYVLDTEDEACVWVGFKPQVTREKFRSLIEAQDTEAILDTLHRFEIRRGDVILIPAGTPHALGSKSLVAEIQEPVDLTLRAERFRPDGSELPEESMHGGIGLEAMLDCFAFDCADRETIRKRVFVEPKCFRTGGVRETVLIGTAQTRRFGMSRIEVCGSVERRNRRFTVGLVLSGAGVLETEDGGIELSQGTEFFIPACVDDYVYRAAGSGELSVLECYPPEPVKTAED